MSEYLSGLHRHIDSDHNAHVVNAASQVGYKLPFDCGFDLYVVGGAQFFHLSQESFTEEGTSNMRLCVDSQDNNSFKSIVGLKADFPLSSGTCCEFRSEVFAYWHHEFADEGGDFCAAYVGLPDAKYTACAHEADRDRALIGASILGQINECWSMRAQVLANVAADYHSFSGSLGVGYSF